MEFRFNIRMKNITRDIFRPMALLAVSAAPFSVSAASVSFEGNSYKVIEEEPSRQSGLNGVFVLHDMAGVSVVYTSANSNVEWSVFSNAGGAYAVSVDNIVKEGNRYILNSPAANSGYIIKDGADTYYFWIVDHSSFPMAINSIAQAADNDCNSVVLEVDGSAPEMAYYGINGRREVLSRDIRLSYNSLEWNETSKLFEEYEVIKNLASVSERIVTFPPAYCETTYRLSGDRFMEEWDTAEEYETVSYFPHAVNVMTEATQTQDSPDDQEVGSNVIKFETSGLGGSAPCDINFTAYVTDGVLHSEWQIAEDEDFENILYRFNEQDINFVFREEGRRYVRFIGSNSDGSCMAFGDTYTVAIGSSELKIPNAFSPDDDGVNDVWKVSYRSLVDFKCSIFNRQGHLLYSFDNPDEGWDGKKNGKAVKPGVYFYVIQATGADGMKYKKSGDINILKYKGRSGLSVGGGGETE